MEGGVVLQRGEGWIEVERGRQGGWREGTNEKM